MIKTVLFQPDTILGLLMFAMAGGLCLFFPIFYQKYKQQLQLKSHILGLALFESIHRPLLVLIMAMGAVSLLTAFCIVWKSEFVSQLYLLRDLILTSLLGWFLWRFIFYYKEAFLYWKSTKLDKAMIHSLAQIARLAILILTFLSILQHFGFSLAGILAFGGMGGIAIGFASKDILANLFGSMMLFLDRPFSIGDQIKISALKVEGTVEEIGLRVCRIRSPECRPIYVPNSLFTNLIVENISRVVRRRFNCQMKLHCTDLQRIPSMIEEMKRVIKENTDIDNNQSITVALNGITDSGVNLIIIAYTKIAVSNNQFLSVQQTLYLELLECMRYYGAQSV